MLKYLFALFLLFPAALLAAASIEAAGLKVNVEAPWKNADISPDPVLLLSDAASVFIWKSDDKHTPATPDDFANWSSLRAQQDLKELDKSLRPTLVTVELFGGKLPAVRVTGTKATTFRFFFLNNGQSAIMAIVAGPNATDIPAEVKTLFKNVTLPNPGKPAVGISAGTQPAASQPARELARRTRISAWAMIALGRYSEALNLANEAIRLDAADGSAWRTRGVALTALGYHGDAAPALQKAIELDRYDDRAWQAMGNLMAREGQSATAKICFETVLKLVPDDPDATAALKALNRPTPDRAKP